MTGKIKDKVKVGVEDVGQQVAGSRVRDLFATNPVANRGGADASAAGEIGLAPIPAS